MSYLVLLGRVLFVWVFVPASVNHLTKTSTMAGYVKSKGLPQAWLATLVSGVVITVGGLMMLLGVWADLGALLLALFLLSTATLMHQFWREEGQNKMMERIQFEKDLALAGAALMLFVLISFAGHDLGLTLTGPLFHLH
jgi:putative oxidoreductase